MGAIAYLQAHCKQRKREKKFNRE